MFSECNSNQISFLKLNMFLADPRNSPLTDFSKEKQAAFVRLHSINKALE